MLNDKDVRLHQAASQGKTEKVNALLNENAHMTFKINGCIERVVVEYILEQFVSFLSHDCA
nr:hypothetical protein [uncultured Gammaproteobacteria bacterium]